MKSAKNTWFIFQSNILDSCTTFVKESPWIWVNEQPYWLISTTYNQSIRKSYHHCWHFVSLRKECVSWRRLAVQRPCPRANWTKQRCHISVSKQQIHEINRPDKTVKQGSQDSYEDIYVFLRYFVAHGLSVNSFRNLLNWKKKLHPRFWALRFDNRQSQDIKNWKIIKW